MSEWTVYYHIPKWKLGPDNVQIRTSLILIWKEQALINIFPLGSPTQIMSHENGKRLYNHTHISESQGGGTLREWQRRCYELCLWLLQCSCSADALQSQNYPEVVHLSVTVSEFEDQVLKRKTGFDFWIAENIQIPKKSKSLVCKH